MVCSGRDLFLMKIYSKADTTYPEFLEKVQHYPLGVYLMARWKDPKSSKPGHNQLFQKR